jgi:hypothetical protein
MSKNKLIRVGFFREMPHGRPGDPSLAEARASAPAPHQAELAAYLDAGHLYIATPSLGLDVFDRKTRIASPHYLTDGRYVWPGDLAHYVRKYNVRLTGEFFEHAMVGGWKVPPGVDISTLSL